MKWFYKLEKDVELEMPTAWSGYVTTDSNASSDAHKAIVAKLGVEKMPPNTLVASQQDLLNGRGPKKVRRQRPQRPKLQAPKKFEDVGMTFDQAEALLKQFGLKN